MHVEDRLARARAGVEDSRKSPSACSAATAFGEADELGEQRRVARGELDDVAVLARSSGSRAGAPAPSARCRGWRDAFSVSAMISAGISPAAMRVKIDRLAHGSSLLHRGSTEGLTSGRARRSRTARPPGRPSRCAARCRRGARGRRRRPSSALELLGRDAALRADDEHDVARRRVRASRRARVVRGRLEHEHAGCRGPARELGWSSSSGATSGSQARMRLLARPRGRSPPSAPGPSAAFGGVPARDAARRLPRDDLVDAELGRRLHRELVAVALRERLHEHDARRGRPRRRSTVVDLDRELARRRSTRRTPVHDECRGRRRS